MGEQLLVFYLQCFSASHVFRHVFQQVAGIFLQASAEFIKHDVVRKGVIEAFLFVKVASSQTILVVVVIDPQCAFDIPGFILAGYSVPKNGFQYR